MNKLSFLLRSICFLAFIGLSFFAKANQQDSVYLFSYSRDEGRSGLLFAWSLDQEEWNAIGPHHRFLFSDFGQWGAQKRMFNPYLYQDKNKVWHCIWTLNEEVLEFAHASTTNLYEWEPQDYPIAIEQGTIQDLEILPKGDRYQVSWYVEENGQQKFYKNYTRNFKDYTETEVTTDDERLINRKMVLIDGKKYRGMIVKLPWKMVETLIKQQEWETFHNQERAELMADDPIRFQDLKGPLTAKITPQPERRKAISDELIGVFFEDINYAADGGIYAELIQNRDFEYQPGDRDFNDDSWTPKKAWSIAGQATFTIKTAGPIHQNNPHYAALDIQRKGASFSNEGWDGIPIESGKRYDFSAFAKKPDRSRGTLRIQLQSEAGKVIGQTSIRVNGARWQKYESTIEASGSAKVAKLVILPEFKGKIDLDMVSLFPQHTFKNRKNGLRADLAQVIADLKPKFVRFPGGCVAHGDGLANLYRWENTIGPLEARVPQRNIWNYHQSAGLGYYEYFQFCEDIDAQPIPIVPAGVPCQNSHTGGHGQQCGIPLEDMDAYIESILHLVEWATGDANTEWGRKRAEAGHPEPFALKYLGVGNEDLITDLFEERFQLIYDAVQKKYPEIIVIGTVGPFYRGSDYEAGWDFAKELNLEIVDEHYYQPPGWFINNQDFYDRYDHNGTKVYLGEYASHLPNRKTNIETALTEAIYLTAVEKNAGLVTMTSYAPLLAKEDHINWNPDLIYFNNTEVMPTTGYYVQQLFSWHSGDYYIPSLVALSRSEQKVQRRLGVSIVQDQESGDIILKMANLLPTSIDAEIDLSYYNVRGEGQLIVLQGEPDDGTALPKESTISAAAQLQYQLPAYSLSVIRFRTK